MLTYIMLLQITQQEAGRFARTGFPSTDYMMSYSHYHKEYYRILAVVKRKRERERD